MKWNECGCLVYVTNIFVSTQSFGKSKYTHMDRETKVKKVVQTPESMTHMCQLFILKICIESNMKVWSSILNQVKVRRVYWSMLPRTTLLLAHQYFDKSKSTHNENGETIQTVDYIPAKSISHSLYEVKWKVVIIIISWNWV